MSKKNLFFLLIICFISFSAYSQGKKTKKLINHIETARADWNVPGVAVAVVKDGEIIINQGFGVKNINTKEAVDKNTLFQIASNSKSFTAAALAMLVDEGKISWNDKVIKYLPWFKLYDPYVTANTTIEDLMCHRVGLGTFSGDLLWYDSEYDREEIVRRASELEQAFGFRNGFGYSNIMYIAAGLIIEEVSGMSWDEFIENRILDPLGMERSNTSVSKMTTLPNYASPHTDSADIQMVVRYMEWDNAAPAAAINSSVNEMTKWLSLQLNRGTLNDKEFYSYSQANNMWAAHNAIPISGFYSQYLPSTHFRAYGLGWGMMDYQGVKVISHSGGSDGMISYSCVVPEKDLGFVILTNSNSSLYFALALKILDTYLSDDEGKDWSQFFLERINKGKERGKKAQAYEEKNRLKNTNPSLELAQYSGVYESSLYGNALVELKENKLVLTLEPAPLFTGTLSHWHLNTFKINLNNHPSLPSGKVNFIIDAKGDVEEMRIDIPNPDFFFTELKFFKQKTK